MKEIKLMETKKREIEYQVKTLQRTPFGNFGLSGIRLTDQKQNRFPIKQSSKNANFRARFR